MPADRSGLFPLQQKPQVRDWQKRGYWMHWDVICEIAVLQWFHAGFFNQSRPVLCRLRRIQIRVRYPSVWKVPLQAVVSKEGRLLIHRSGTVPGRAPGCEAFGPKIPRAMDAGRHFSFVSSIYALGGCRLTGYSPPSSSMASMSSKDLVKTPRAYQKAVYQGGSLTSERINW